MTTTPDPDRDPAEPAAAPHPPQSETGAETGLPDTAADAAPDVASNPEPAPAEALDAPAEPAPPVSGNQTRAGFQARGPEPLVAAPDPRLLEVLVCPVTRGMLEYDKAAHELVSRSAKLAYPIRDGIPIMLPEEARALADAEA